ncbi:lipoprotein [Spiroplasma endosymbiont of Clivina fossor]|uniref:lipoprotein n=1 Tax=Spiroplasma endosymbiont of Clivina fossor TaxID=3066282 RepID=UPI00313CFD6E
MKKLLSIVAAVSLTATGASTISACKQHEKFEDTIFKFIKKIDDMFENPTYEKTITEKAGIDDWNEIKNNWNKQKENFSNIDYSTISKDEKESIIVIIKEFEKLFKLDA